MQFDSSGQRSDVTLDIFQSIGILHTSSSSNIEDAAAVMVGSWSTSKGLLWAKVCIQMKLLCFCSSINRSINVVHYAFQYIGGKNDLTEAESQTGYLGTKQKTMTLSTVLVRETPNLKHAD